MIEKVGRSRYLRPIFDIAECVTKLDLTLTVTIKVLCPDRCLKVRTFGSEPMKFDASIVRHHLMQYFVISGNIVAQG
jgi:hypothetical protein